MWLLSSRHALLAAALLAVALAAAAGYRAGHRHAAQTCAAEKADALARAIAQAEAVARQDAEVLTAHEDRRERIRAAFQNIREGVTRYVENHAGAADECLDADGMRLWLAANDGVALAPPQPDYRLPGPAAPTLGTRGGLAGQPRADGGAVSRLPGEAPGAGGVGKE